MAPRHVEYRLRSADILAVLIAELPPKQLRDPVTHPLLAIHASIALTVGATAVLWLRKDTKEGGSIKLSPAREVLVCDNEYDGLIGSLFEEYGDDVVGALIQGDQLSLIHRRPYGIEHPDLRRLLAKRYP